MLKWPLLFVVVGCGGEPKEAENQAPKCDGLLQDGEGGVVDSPFDQDGDGYFDISNDDCAATYDPNNLDCDDADVNRFPGNAEVACNTIDDDCNPDTADALDYDLDGSIFCDDCDDDDALRFPGNNEVCWDDIDNDCDGEVDPGCGENYNGEFALDQQLVYQCSFMLVNIDFSSVGILWNPPGGGTLFNIGTGQPGALNGTINEDGSFVFEEAIQLGTAAACDEYYRFSGQFDGPERFVGTFEALYLGGIGCLNCQPQLWEGIVGTRTGDLQ